MYLTIPTDDQGLKNLEVLIALNPRMRAVSIVDLYLGAREEVHELLGFLEFLEYNCPLVTCLCLHITSFNRSASTQVMNKVLQQRLGFIDKGKVVDVDIRQCQGLDKSERGLPCLSLSEDNQTSYWPANRRTDEKPDPAPQIRHLAVLENNGGLKAALPTTAIGSISAILELFPTLRRLCVRQERPDKDLALLKVLPVALPNLQELDLAIGRLDATRLAEFLNDTRATDLACFALCVRFLVQHGAAAVFRTRDKALATPSPCDAQV